MKALWILPQGSLPRLKDFFYVKVTKDNLSDIIHRYSGVQVNLCLAVQPEVDLAGLLRFIESFVGELVVVVHETPDLVFMSRFVSVKKRTEPTISPFPPASPLEGLLEETKRLCQSK